ncbi:MAG: uroporphyrinogen-III C-methyltransferase [Nitrospirae bacterium]|nr:uroporphyrinogen-III C-methyltransferase [Nitrospirota bacterium]MBF0533562.1 uroporphyrinogen-III C-methyltransferase [Nitrospirota bacterium]MBF0615914.1 uroporphyrinogen-III C-methyltransferase [Nitrospirota bacterium]
MIRCSKKPPGVADPKGKVYLTGAGPGDIGLLTVKALKCLKNADVIVYDFHINAQILNYAKEGAELVYAGKRGGHHDMNQDAINAALVQLALAGKSVCRLKGGDPFVFGRGGEEAEVLASHGIEFEIIPGVSSAISVPAYAGIPITHRKHSSSFAVITGNEDETRTGSRINWQALAGGFDTLVFLMGVKNLSFITQKLIEHGKSADTPAAVIRWGTRPEQTTITGVLQNIASLSQAEHIRPPAIMVVGTTVLLRDTLNWFETRPLFGERILITRPYSAEYEPLESLGAEIFEFPTIKIVLPESFDELDAAIDNVESYDWLIFTSSSGVDYFIKRLLEKAHDIRDLKGIGICAIGIKTKEAVEKYGMRVDEMPDEFNAEGLIKLFESKNGIKSKRFLLPRAEKARETFPERVRALGGYIDTPVTYRAINQIPHIKRLERFLRERRITTATFTSAATFTNLLDSVSGSLTELLSGVTIAVIGPVTKKAIEKHGLKVDIMPERATIADMVSAIVENKLTTVK